MPDDEAPYAEHDPATLDPRVRAAWYACMARCLARRARPGKRIPKHALDRCRDQAILESFAVAAELGIVCPCPAEEEPPR